MPRRALPSLPLPLPLLRQFGRYLLVGGAAAVVDVGLFLLLLAAGMPLVPAAALAFAIAVVFNFFLSARVVFETEASQRRFVLFVLFATLGGAVNTAVTAAGVIAFGMAPALSKLTGIACAFLFNFAMNALVVFRRRPAGPG